MTVGTESLTDTFASLVATELAAAKAGPWGYYPTQNDALARWNFVHVPQLPPAATLDVVDWADVSRPDGLLYGSWSPMGDLTLAHMAKMIVNRLGAEFTSGTCGCRGRVAVRLLPIGLEAMLWLPLSPAGDSSRG